VFPIIFIFGFDSITSGSGDDCIITGCDTDLVCILGDSVCVVVVVGLLDLLDGVELLEDEEGLGGGGEGSCSTVQFCIS
jgi:hypothetical protein